MKIICDELDLFLIQTMYDYSLEGKELTDWELCKLYHWGDEYKINQIGHNYYYNKKVNIVKYRLTKMRQCGLLHIREDEHMKRYELEGKKVILCPVKKVKNVLDKDSNVIMVKGSEGWIIYEV